MMPLVTVPMVSIVAFGVIVAILMFQQRLFSISTSVYLDIEAFSFIYK